MPSRCKPTSPAGRRSLQQQAAQNPSAVTLLPTPTDGNLEADTGFLRISLNRGSHDTVGSAPPAMLAVVEPVLAEMVDHHAERGDTQTPVTLAIVSRSLLPNLIPRERLRRLSSAYVELLHRLQLFSLSNEIIKLSDDEELNKLSLASTTIQLGRPKKLPTGQSLCTVCHTPVRGLYVWCQGCGHGGHLDHLQAWFSQSTDCPAGCGHRCQANLLQIATSLQCEDAIGGV